MTLVWYFSTKFFFKIGYSSFFISSLGNYLTWFLKDFFDSSLFAKYSVYISSYEVDLLLHRKIRQERKFWNVAKEIRGFARYTAVGIDVMRKLSLSSRTIKAVRLYLFLLNFYFFDGWKCVCNIVKRPWYLFYVFANAHKASPKIVY